jgi:hypothetical protein
MHLSKKKAGANYNAIITNKKAKGSHGLLQDSFKLQIMTALIKSFYGGVQMFHGGGFFKKSPPWLATGGKKWRDLTEENF